MDENLLVVIKDKEVKIAQIDHYDAPPEGRGLEILTVIRGRVEELGKILSEISPYSLDESKTSFQGETNLPHAPGNNFLVLRDVLAGKKFTFTNNYLFAAYGDLCEWCYVIDYDKETFEVYRGKNREPLTENDRFFDLKDKVSCVSKEYHPVKLLCAFDLNNLPEGRKFLLICYTELEKREHSNNYEIYR